VDLARLGNPKRIFPNSELSHLEAQLFNGYNSRFIFHIEITHLIQIVIAVLKTIGWRIRVLSCPEDNITLKLDLIDKEHISGGALWRGYNPS
jgi:hypothetical protein